MASLFKWLGDAANAVGQTIDNVVPGNQSALHRPTAPQPVQRPVQQAPRPNLGNLSVAKQGQLSNTISQLAGIGQFAPKPIQSQIAPGNALTNNPAYATLEALPLGPVSEALKFGDPQFQEGQKAPTTKQFVKKIAQSGYANSPLGAAEQVFGGLANEFTKRVGLNDGYGTETLSGPTSAFSNQVADNGLGNTILNNAMNVAGAVVPYEAAPHLPQAPGNYVRAETNGLVARNAPAIADASVHLAQNPSLTAAGAIHPQIAGIPSAGFLAGDNAVGKRGKMQSPIHGNDAFFEVSDKNMKLHDNADAALRANMKTGAVAPLSSVIKHTELGKQYPDVFNGTKVVYDDTIPRPSQYNYDTKTIHINPDAAENATPKGIRESIGHEYQHAIDEFEGLPRGTTIRTQYSKEGQAALDAADTHYQKLQAEAKGFDMQMQAKLEALIKNQGMDRKTAYQTILNEKDMNPVYAQLEEALAERNHIASRGTAPTRDELAYNDYVNNIAEGRAHTMQGRLDMSQRQIDKNPIDASWGIKPGEVSGMIQRSGIAGYEGQPRDLGGKVSKEIQGETSSRASKSTTTAQRTSTTTSSLSGKAGVSERMSANSAEKRTSSPTSTTPNTREPLSTTSKLPAEGATSKTKTSTSSSSQANDTNIAARESRKPTLPEVPKKQEVKTPTPAEKVATLPTKDYIKEQVAKQEAARKGETPNLKGKAKSFMSEVKTKLIDSNAPIEDVLDSAIKGGADIKPTNNIKYQIDKTLRAGELSTQFARDHGLVDAIVDAPNVDELNQYLIAKHSQDLAAKKITTGRNDAADAKLVKDLGSKYEPFAKKVNQYSQKLLDYATEKGLVSKELAKQLKEEYPNYVPMNRIFSDSEQQAFKGNGRGPASISGQSVVQRLKGSERQVENPLESLLVKTQDAFKQGELNDSARMLASYKDLPGNPFSLRELKTGETIGDKHTISYLDNGKKRVFETTPEIANAAKSLNKEQLGLVGKILSVPTRVLRLGATGVNLPFVASNIVRDQVTSFINSDKAMATSIANPGNFLRALFNAVDHGKEYENLLRNGAGGTSFDVGRDAAHNTIKRLRSERNMGSRILYTVTRPAELLRAAEDMVGRSEELGRIQQFTGTRDALLKQGKTPKEANILAAHAARNNSTNFARSGDYGRVLNAVLPYLNAGVQGSRTFVRNMQTRPTQTAAKVALTTLMPVAAVTAWNLSDPTRKQAYDNIQEFEKGGNIIIVPPNPTQDDKGRWNVIKIPMSQEIASIADAVRNGVEAAGNDKAFNIAKMAGDLIGSATSLNANEPRQLVGQVIPQALKPAIEGLTNTNLFTGNQIVPQSLQNYPAGKQYKPNTSGTAVQIGKALGISPLQIQNAIGTAAGGVGNQLLNASDRALVAAGVTQPSQVAGQDALDNTLSKFTKAKGTSADQLKYQAEDAAKKAKAAAGAPKALAAAGLEGDGSMKGVDPKAQTRITTAQGKLAPSLPKTASKTILDYAKLDANAKTAFNNDPAKVYQLHLAQYQNDKANGKLNQVEDYKKLQDLGKEAVTSKYSQEVQQLYGMSKTEQSAYLSQLPKAQATDLYNQAKQLDTELGDKQFATGTKYKYGLGKKPKAGKKFSLPKSSGIASRSTSAMNKLVSSAHIKAPKMPHAPKVASYKVPKTRTISKMPSIPRTATITPPRRKNVA